MNRQMTLAEMNDEFGAARTNKKDFLNKMDSIIPWDTFVKEIEPHYYKGERGNKPYSGNACYFNLQCLQRADNARQKRLACYRKEKSRYRAKVCQEHRRTIRGFNGNRNA